MNKENTLLTNIIESKLTPAGDWRKVVKQMSRKRIVRGWNGTLKKLVTEECKDEV